MPDATSVDPCVTPITKGHRRDPAQRRRLHQAVIQAELRRLSSVHVDPLERTGDPGLHREGQPPAA